MAKPIRVLVVSSVAPRPTAGGPVVLYRHLYEDPQILPELVPEQRTNRLLVRLRRTRLASLLGAFDILRGGRRWDGPARGSLSRGQKPDVILTAAHGDGWKGALRLARRTRIPLVTFFHDWWPDIPVCPQWARRWEETKFRELYFGSAAALCVGEGMMERLGAHNGAVLLPPLPESIPEPKYRPTEVEEGRVYRILYSGNLHDYGPMLRAAMLEFEDHQSVRLEVRGSNPNWPTEFSEAARARGTWIDFASRPHVNSWLASADAFLIPMSFEGRMRRRMETSFPSKLIEFAHFGKPLIVWGPEYCSAVQWARNGSRGFCVTDEDAGTLRAAIERLAQSKDALRMLGEKARIASTTGFDRSKIQEIFFQTLVRVSCASEQPN